MVGILPEENLEKLAEILQNNHSLSLELNLNQLELVDKSARSQTRRKPILLPPNEDDAELERIRILEVYANREANEAHLTTPHFLKYKEGTAEMVRSLRLLDVDPVMMRGK